MRKGKREQKEEECITPGLGPASHVEGEVPHPKRGAQ